MKENERNSGQIVGPVIGIDLGTTNSCVAVFRNERWDIIPNADGANTTPSIVAYTKNGRDAIGGAAKRQAILNPENTFFGTKRLIGKTYDQVEKTIKEHGLPYKVKKGSKGECVIESFGKELSPIAIGADILSYLKKCAETYLGTPVKNAIITVPAYFDDSQRQATINAGEIAGLNVLRIINEPTAAALAYGLDKSDQKRKIIVFDLGGGTFDVTVLSIEDGVFEVISTGGDTSLGGDDFNFKLVNYLVEEYKKMNNDDLKAQDEDLPQRMQRLYEAAEKAKIELSSKMATEINLPFIKGKNHLIIEVSKAKLEQLCEDLIKKTIKSCEEVLNKSGFAKSEINDIILVGGQTRMPKVKEEVAKFFGKEPSATVNPDEVVAAGAAIQGGVLKGDVKDILLLDVISLSLGIETLGGIFTKMIEANTSIPTKKSMVFSTAMDNQPAVSVRVFQGERKMANDNKLLGNFDLNGIPPAPRGVPQIEVTFEIDVNGVLHVTAKELASNKEQKVTITQSVGGLSDEEIKKMKEDAAAHAEEDEKKAKLIEAKNRAENMIHTANKTLEENQSTLSNELKTTIKERVDELQKALNENTLEGIEEAEKKLSEEMMKVYGEISKNAKQEPAPESTPSEENK